MDGARRKARTVLVDIGKISSSIISGEKAETKLGNGRKNICGADEFE